MARTNHLDPETLPPEVVSSLGHYVYVLRDPTVTPPEVFYVGKGTGYRAFAHQHGAASAANISDDDDRAVRRAKSDRIRELRARGGRVEHLFVRTNIDGDTAFTVEQAVIDAFDAAGHRLTNLVKGHGSRAYGLATVDDLIVRLGARPSPPLPSGTMLVKIPRWHAGMTADETYNQTRQWWPIAARRVPRITAMLGLVDGVVRSAYQVDPDGWERRVAVFGKREGPSARWSATGRTTPLVEPYLLTHVRDIIDIRTQNPCRFPGW